MSGLRLKREDLYPWIMVPVIKDYPWGGNRLRNLYGKIYREMICAEAWEVADRSDGESIIGNGALAGVSFGEVFRENRELVAGKTVKGDRFPLLIKLIDAAERLSIQVHPDEKVAEMFNVEPKTEMWYFLEGSEGSYVYVGFREKVTKDLFRKILRENEVEILLNRIDVAPDRVIFVPAGTLHCIGPGCIILEIQQNSDTTFRVYDWGRLDHRGRSRPLHITEALEAIHWDKNENTIITPLLIPWLEDWLKAEVILSPYFNVEKIVSGEKPLVIKNDNFLFRIIFVQYGNLTIEVKKKNFELKKGHTCFIPAGIENFTLIPHCVSSIIVISLS